MRKPAVGLHANPARLTDKIQVIIHHGNSMTKTQNAEDVFTGQKIASNCITPHPGLPFQTVFFMGPEMANNTSFRK